MMMEFLSGVVDTLKKADPAAVFFIAVVLLALRAFQKALRSQSNTIELWHFYSSRGQDGAQYGDPNKLGIMVGIFASTVIVGFVFYMQKVDNGYMITMWGLWLVFIAGSDAFAKWFRSFIDKRFTGPTPKDSSVVETVNTVNQVTRTTEVTPPVKP